jgi:SAM-dependent methyltransferase
VAHPERIVPAQTSPGIVALHLKRYEFALAWCDAAEVLDAGCGVGYGSAFLARGARRVVGVDRNGDGIEYARAHYAADNVEYLCADVLELPLADASFDVVCAFETIEHLDDPRGFLREAARVLAPEGVALVSTPRVDRTTRAPENPHHLVELSAADFERLLHERFETVDLYGQRRLRTARHRLLARLDVLGLRRRVPAPPGTERLLGTAPTTSVRLDGIVIERGRLEGASELVAVCRRPLR